MPRQKSQQSAEVERLAGLLEDLKRLTILQLMSTGVQVTQIAKALGVNKSTVSRLVPLRAVHSKS
jgi:IS30 family transposase